MLALLPDLATLQSTLKALSMKQLAALAERSGISASAIYKIRSGETADPGIRTVERLAASLLAAINERGAEEVAHMCLPGEVRNAA